MPKNTKRICSFLATLALYLQSYSQCALSGKIIDSLNAPVPFVTVALLNQSDSSVYKGILSDENGTYCFEKIKKGNYIIRATSLGYAHQFSKALNYDSLNAISVNDIKISKSGVALNEVSINAIKDPIEFKGGNITVNIEDSPLAVGNNAYDLIARLPGVMVENDNISIQGKGGVKVFMDDRVLQMSGAQLINFLRSLNASSIEKIEILNNPPARYDAAGSGGIINIKTKKIKITGFSGNVNYTFSQGIYNNNNGGFTLNYKGRKFAVFSSVNAYEGLIYHRTDFTRTIKYDSYSTTLKEKYEETDAAQFATINLGADWYINKKNTVGFKAQAIPGHAMRTINGSIDVSDTSLGYNRLNYNRPVGNNWYLANYNVNAEHLFDTLGTRLKFSADYYGPYYDIYDAFYQNHFYKDGGPDTLVPQIFRSTNAIGINVLAARLDFEKSFRKGLRLETGIKQNYQFITSDFSLENKNDQTQQYVTDADYTNEFSYAESISAGYLTFAKDYKKMNFQMGVRAENTDINTISHTSNISYKRQYFNIFPVASADYNPNKNHSLSLSYNRRIYRPDYNSYNPFRSFINVLNSSEGNPYLAPIYDNNINFNYIFKRKISNYFSYSYQQNPVFQFTSQVDSSRQTIQHAINAKDLTIIRYNLFIRQEIKKWWTVSMLAGTYYIGYSGNFGDNNYSKKALPYYGRLTFLFLLKKDTKIEVSGFYWGPWLGAASVFSSRGGLSWSVKKSFLDNTWFLSVGMNDVFYTEPFRNVSDLQNQKWERIEAHDSRRLNLSISYNFGKIKAQQRQTKENDEEKRRMGR